MTEEKDMIRIVKDLFKKWEFLVTNQGYQFDVLYFTNHLESGGKLSDEHTRMQCCHQWRYKKAGIAVNLATCIAADDNERLEWVVIHELVHMLMGECEYEAVAMEERVCSEITSAILQAAAITK